MELTVGGRKKDDWTENEEDKNAVSRHRNRFTEQRVSALHLLSPVGYVVQTNPLNGNRTNVEIEPLNGIILVKNSVGETVLCFCL